MQIGRSHAGARQARGGGDAGRTELVKLGIRVLFLMEIFAPAISWRPRTGKLPAVDEPYQRRAAVRVRTKRRNAPAVNSTVLVARKRTDDTIYMTQCDYPFRCRFSSGLVGGAPQVNLAWWIDRHMTWTHDLARFLISNSDQRTDASLGPFINLN